MSAWPGGDAIRDTLIDALDDVPQEDHLLGWPDHNTLAYDPTPGPGWVPLLTVASHEQLDWCWQDDDNLMVFIEADRLAALDFSTLRCDAG